ncbi:hypothetical protein D3C72_2414160 [compost metagenome]
MAGIGDDRLGHLDLAIVEIEKRPVLVDRRDADDGEIDLELADEIDRCFADDTTVGSAHHTAGNHHLD